MIIEHVDPRDVSWEDDRPTYRVYFWHQPPAAPEVPQERMGYHCDEYRLLDAADVHEVITWATGRARSDQTYTLYVEHRDSADRLGLVILAGSEPTAAA